jgi:O-antigen ligase
VEGTAPLPPPGNPAPRVATVVSVVAWLGLVALVVATAGAVGRAWGAVVAGFFLARVVSGRLEPVEGRRPAKWAVGAFLLACAIQLVPLPEAVRGVIAPGPTSARRDLRELGLQGSWAPITVDVGATVFEALLWAGAAAALAVVARPSGPPLGAKAALIALVATHAFGWVDFVAGWRVMPLTRISDAWGVGQDALRHGDFATGWLIDRNHWAALGLLLWPFAIGWAMRTGGERPPIGRVALGTCGAAMVVASLLATRSRAGTAIFAVQAVALIAFLAVRFARGRGAGGRRAFVVGGLVALAAIVTVVALGWSHLAKRLTGEDVEGRRDLYAAGARLAGESPAIGWGMGTFKVAFPSVQPDGLYYQYSHAHCDPLENVIGAGALGAAATIALLLAMRAGAREPRAGGAWRMLWALAVGGCAASSCVEFPLQVTGVRFAWLCVLFSGPPRSR